MMKPRFYLVVCKVYNFVLIVRDFFARQGARRANTHWYLTNEQRGIAEKDRASDRKI